MITPTAPAPYDQKFFASVHAGAGNSAHVALSLLSEIHHADTVFDLGCGSGAWLAAAESLGSTRLIGWDGPWVDKANLASASIEFTSVDLQGSTPRPPTADIAMSLEVAEHITESKAGALVKALCDSAGVVVFSAAIPHQGGTNHVNERPQSYWVEKFAERGYTCFDFFRPKLWNDSRVEWWYRQNLLLFVDPAHPLHAQIGECGTMPADVVHPEMMAKVASYYINSFERPSLKTCRTILGRWLAGKFGR
jgi:predicted RNA methylase